MTTNRRSPSLRAAVRRFAPLSSLVLASALLQTGCGSTDDSTPRPDVPDTGWDGDESDVGRPGDWDFLSAGAAPGSRSPEAGSDAGGAAPPETDDGRGDEADPDRTVEEGDIFRVLGDGLLLNLNAFRGVQVIDYSDLGEPSIVGRLQVSGSPVEMYVVGQRAWVLLNNWQSYYGNRTDIGVEEVSGGLVLGIDFSDPTAPQEISRAVIPGYITTSRLTRQGDRVALYAVAQIWRPWDDSMGDDGRGGPWYNSVSTVVQSWDLSDGTLEARTQIDLGGYVTAVQATPEALLVARWDWNSSDRGSMVSVVDISNADGSMVEGAQVRTRGEVRQKTGLDLYRNVLRVVSTDSWGATNTNWIETFDATNIQTLTPIDAESFGDGMDLFATLFLGNKAFFVTYFRIDPLHAFEITDEGDATEISEFEISGWNDWFRPVFGETRMVGIGVNDEGGRNTLAVSLYDITDLANPNPFIARAEVQADQSWSEASWDDRGFTVIENAVAVEAPDGSLETGLVLLPFTGWDSRWESYQASVQIYTFGPDTLTRRGLMDHGTQVRRSFLADDDVTANLSEAAISFFDTHDPDAPEEASRLDLAPNYTRVWAAGDHLLRLNDSMDWYFGWWGTRAALPDSALEVIPASADDPDSAVAVAIVPVPAGASVLQAGDLFVTLQESRDGETRTAEVRVWDLSSPTRPTQRSTFRSSDLVARHSYYGGWEDCWDCGYGQRWNEAATWATERALTILQTEWQQEVLGLVRYCESWSAYRYCDGGEWYPEEDGGSRGQPCDANVQGYRWCTSRDGGPEVCQGEFQRCRTVSGEYVCEPYTPADDEIETNCYEYEDTRSWPQYTFRSLDLSRPDAPTVLDAIALPIEEEGVQVFQEGNRLWVSTRVPVTVPGDGRPWVRWYVRALDLSDPSQPVLGERINVPGRVIAVEGDRLYTQDEVWGAREVETTVNVLQRQENRAVRLAIHTFGDHWVEKLVLDGAGHLIASHRENRWDYWGQDTSQELTMLDADTLAILGSTPIDLWANLTDARNGRALFSVPGGLLVVNVESPASPHAQAYFTTRGWPQSLQTIGDRVIFAAGRFGIQSFGLDEYNLRSE